MDCDGWAGRAAPEELGAVAHGPALLGSDGAVAAGLRCAFAYPQGVELVIVLAAVEVRADDGSLHIFPRPEEVGRAPWHSLQVTVTADGRTGCADAFQSQASGGGDRFRQECRYFIEPLPAGPMLLVAVAWPEIGLTEHRTELRLDLDRVDERIIPLLPGR